MRIGPVTLPGLGSCTALLILLLRHSFAFTIIASGKPSVPDVVVIGRLMIDHHIGSDGERTATRLGGGAFQAAFGARAWSSSAGIVAPVGDDFDHAHAVAAASLARMAIDAQGVARLPGFATPCLKITYDGETMKWEPTAGWDRWVELQQTDLPLPPHYAHAQVVHVLTEADGMAETRMACTLKAERLDAILSVEPVLFDLPNVMATVTGLLPLLSAADVVSPDWPAACAIAGADAASADPEAVLRGCRSRMQLKGGALLAVRCGSRGSYLLWGTRAERWAHVPAFPLPDPVQDPTGAGNAYCGALAACLARGGPGALADTARVLKAAAQASATGAAVVQVDGLPELGAALNAQLSRYCDDIASRTRILSVP